MNHTAASFNSVASRAKFRPEGSAWRQADLLATLPISPFGDSANDAGFVLLRNALRSSGGLISGEELALRLNDGDGAGYARLARWIVGRQAFSFAWHDSFWLPMFQFDPHDWTLRPDLRPVLRELLDVMDGWAVAVWFVQANEALQGRSPLSLCAGDASEVLHAARLQRYVMKA